MTDPEKDPRYNPSLPLPGSAGPGECVTCGRPGPAYTPCRYCVPASPTRPTTLFDKKP